MGNITPSYAIVSPSYIMPELIMKYQQVSGAYDLIADRAPLVRLGSEDLYIYAKTLDIRTKIAAGQVAYNQLPSVTMVAAMISTPTYLLRVRAEYDHHDIAAGGNWGISIPEGQRLGMRQGTFQSMRVALLYGMNPANGEGLTNTPGATAVSLPADSNGNTTVQTYDNGQMAFFLAAQVNAAKTRCMQLGMPVRVSVVGPQRVLGAFEYQNIVQLTQFQRTGAGSASTKGVFGSILEENGDTLDWNYDDTLQGKGQGGTDMVIISIPEVEKPTTGNTVNTNTFADLTPSIKATSVQLCDMAAPREIPTPLPGGAIDVLSELRVSSGWGLRPEALTLVSMAFQ